MSSITINYQNATLTSTSSQIMVNGATIGLSPSYGLSMSGTISFSSLYITSGMINFSAGTGTMFAASVVVPVSSTGSTPELEVTNFAGTVIVTWPTANGLQSQQVFSGDPIMLNGYVE